MSWGTGYFGQLGHGDDSSWDSPRMIQALEPRRLGGGSNGSRVTAVACGGSHSGALTDSGRVFMWGLNRGGQCGVASSKGKSDSILEPRPVDFSNSNTSNNSSSNSISSGIMSSFLGSSSSSGSGKSNGANDLGGPILVRSLVLGRNHSAAVTTAGRVFVWGEGGFGRLGLNDVPMVSKSVGGAAKKCPQQTVPAELEAFKRMPVAALAAGDWHMLALTQEGHVYSWGYGADGQTGHCTVSGDL